MTTAEDIFGDFKEMMAGLEKGLQVIHITTPTAQLLCCQHNNDIAAVFTRPDILQFDQIPVKKGETIIGLLNRRKYVTGTTGRAKDQMSPLGEDILVSADTPLLVFIKDKNNTLDRLVIRGTQIYGLVTRSDLLKLPVYLLGFALVTHIESQMLDMIRLTKIDQETWIKWVPSKNREHLGKKYNELRKEKSDPDMLDLTFFLDKLCILQQLSYRRKYASFLPEKNFIDQLPELKELRNMVDHGDNHSDDNNSLQIFINRLCLADEWIAGIKKWKETR